jgi:hypothetical protein
VNTNFYLDYFARRNVTARRTLGRELDRGFALGTNFVAGFTTTTKRSRCPEPLLARHSTSGWRIIRSQGAVEDRVHVEFHQGAVAAGRENRFRVTAVHGSGRVLGEATATVTRTAP